ncbi:hypothetical protein Fmac_008616 [Flemingia macrophylla]|uniref:Uncharacterized protein n=1 Tax=Flemingia macrophylla TaxID=520843 RepID=A0ABD1MXW7_9FABA
MHHLCPRSGRHPSLSRGFAACQALVWFFALHRIKPMLHRLCGPPSIPLSFILTNVLPWRDTTTGVSNPIRSPSFHLSVSAQQSAFAVGVLSDLYAFHRSTGNSLCPYRTPAW